jgi:putative toxin-antitoxin system antitoxin component (TIGR02293 family)
MQKDPEKTTHRAKRGTSGVTAGVQAAATTAKQRARPKAEYGRTGRKRYFGKTGPYGKVIQVFISYDMGESVVEFVEKIRGATPMQLVDIERKGVGGRLLKDIAKTMDIPTSRFFKIVGVPKATAEKKASGNQVIAGAGGQATLGVVRLLGIAQSIVDNSTSDEARDFDAAKWLGQWIERPQPALGGKKPSELLDTPTGIELVSRVLGAIESGAYL